VGANGGAKLPVIAELPVGSLAPGRRIGLAQYRQALTVLKALPAEMAGRVNLVRAPSTEAITLELAGGPAILFGPAERLGDKRFALEAVTEKATAEGLTLASIDVRVPDRPAALPK
jgi:cell division protein FtsQ